MQSYPLSEILYALRSEIEENFSQSLWVRAEVSECHENQSGHCYLELIEKDGQNKTVAKVRASIWAAAYKMIKPYFESEVGQPLQAGMRVLVEANFSFHEVYGLSLNITDIEPSYTLGEISLQREEILRRLEADGVKNMNKELVMPMLPRRVAVVSSPTAAGYGDFVNQLQTNRYAYKITCTLFPAAMQGEQTESSVIAALDNISQRVDEFDVVAIIRGGGATSELSAFDNYNIGYYCTQFPLPILSGIGHQRDLSVVDMVAYQSMKTPTAVADFLIDCFADFEGRIDDLKKRLVQVSTSVVETEKENLQYLKMRIFNAPQRILNMRGRNLDVLLYRLREAMIRNICAKRQQLLSLQQRISLLSPDECFARGYVRIVKDNKWMKQVSSLQKNDHIRIQFGDGEKTAVIE